MIGNDIVDLKQAETDSNWERKGYLDKIFTTEEQFMITSGIQPSIMVWLLWSMKESAYKIYSRQTKLQEFAPLKLHCSNLIIHNNKATGNVQYGDQLYYTKSVLHPAYIHTVASINESDLEKVKIKITDYKTDNSRNANPESISHHGAYLALVYL